MEGMKSMLKTTLVTIVFVVASCQAPDMMLRNVVEQKVADAGAKDGRITLQCNALVVALGSTVSLPVVQPGLSTPQTQSFTILNNGSTSLTVSGVSLANSTGTGLFTVLTRPGASVAPGGTTTFSIAFDPGTAQGTSTAALSITTNDADHPKFTINLSATADGTAPVGTVSFASGTTVFSSVVVNLVLTGSDSGGGSLAQMQFSNDGATWSTAEPFSTTKNGWSLSSGDGTKTVLMRLMDSVGNVSGSFSSPVVTLDTSVHLGLTDSTGSRTSGTTLTYPVTKAGTTVSTTFTIKNTGVNALNLGTVSLGSQTGGTTFTLGGQPGTTSLTSNQSTTFTVAWTPPNGSSGT